MSSFKWTVILILFLLGCTQRTNTTLTVSSKDYYIQKINRLKQGVKYPDTTCIHHNAVVEKFAAENLDSNYGLGILFFINDGCSSCISEFMLLLKKLKEDSMNIPIFLVHKHNDSMLVEYYMTKANIEYNNLYKYYYYSQTDEQFGNLSEDSNDIFLTYNRQIILFVK